MADETKNTRQDLKKQASELKDTAKRYSKEEMQKARMNIQKQIDKAKKDLQKMEAKMDNYVKTNPKKAVSIAAGIGVAVGAGLTAMMLKKR